MKETKSKIGQRHTQQRDAIFKIIKNSKGPLAVNDIHQLAQNEGHSIGIATVYRTIKLLLEGDEIKSVTLPDGQLRYEVSALEHHHHFHCTRCGLVIDINKCCAHFLDDDVDGHLIETHEITMFGICKSCRKKYKPINHSVSVKIS